MPATEQTWRNLKFLHVLFGLTSLLMLVCTLWMLAADHNREWKQFQRKFRDVEAWTASSRIDDQQTVDYLAKERELKQDLDKARAAPPDTGLIEEFRTKATLHAAANDYDMDGLQVSILELSEVHNDRASEGAASEAEHANEIVPARQKLIASMQAIVRKARFDEDNKQGTLKFRRADLDVERSKYDLAVGEGASATQLASLEAQVNVVKQEVDELNGKYQTAKTHRTELQKLLDKVTAEEALAEKNLQDHEVRLQQLHATLSERTATIRKGILESPIIDAFGRPLKPDQIWLPQLTLNLNFSDVARFDRCITCHQGIDKTAPGSAVEPGYEPEHVVETIVLPTPEKAPEATELVRDADGKETAEPLTQEQLLDRTYGIRLADQGLIDPTDVTVEVVRPKSLAATALLKAGDVLLTIADVKILDKSRAYAYLLESVQWGQALQVTVRRGVPHPYSSHPRLDLYVGSLSPHKMGDLGCTICHEGQGSATQFKWASHTPNSPAEGEQWQKDHGWFNNHHWIYPMQPERFLESSCLKCHHDVTELEPSQRFRDPPAPKLTKGHDLITQFGCFGCHEINGFDGPKKRRGPDLRSEPPYHAAAAQLLADVGLTGSLTKLQEILAASADDNAAMESLAELNKMQELAQEVIDHPEQVETRKQLAELILADRDRGQSDANNTEGAAADEEPTTAAARIPMLSSTAHKLATILGADDETPGTLRKVGPSLRHVASKVDFAFLYNWIREPKDFRPSTKMPQFFELYDHLTPEEKLAPNGQPLLDAHGHPQLEESAGLRDAKRFEPVEIRAISQYLLTYSQPFEYLEFPEGVEKPSEERGKQQFQTRGCLACHQHKDFPEIKATQGPDLSRIGSKLRTENGERWLYSWVRQPNRYHSRTVMPNMQLDVITKPDGTRTDPADDITAYLLKSQGWEPKPVPEQFNENDLDELTRIYLSGSYPPTQAGEYATSGIPLELRDEAKGDDRELLQEDAMTPERLIEKKLLYVGRRSISRLGCAGCHDIPGYEDAKPIGTGLADWGRKETSKLAFEQIVPYLQEHTPADLRDRGQQSDDGHGESGHGHLSPAEMDPDVGYFVEALLHHQREGFLWQKLREPRSYDYMKTENKEYTDRLRMPKFNLSQDQIEAVMTFVLGLVAEPPAPRYVYNAEPRRRAIVEGERVLNKFNCGGCHTLGMESWEFQYNPDTFQPAGEFKDYAFLKPHFSPAELTDPVTAGKVDRRGMAKALITGMPSPEVGEDDDGNPLLYMQLWQPAVLNGQPWLVGDAAVEVPEADILRRYPPHGGDFARFVHPIALKEGREGNPAEGRKANPNLKESDVWGWVPPPLVREGQKVQTNWLYDFLLNPYPIRPAVVLRMPKFNMSPDEASKLVDYFAAMDDAEYPYEYNSRSSREQLPPSKIKRLNEALSLVTDKKTYCVKCHLLGDYVPDGGPPDWAPNLDRVYQRLRPDYLEAWLANPQRKLPYTGMPINFPPKIDPNENVRRQLIPGDSHDALEAVADLLLNFDAFVKSQTSMKSLVKEPPPEDKPPEEEAAANDESARAPDGFVTPATEDGAGGDATR